MDESLTKKPEISIVIALYNAEKEIGICLDSIFNSDWKKFEVIIVDDCSTDSSLKIARRYPCTFLSTKVNSGPARARNIGVRESKADIILFLDSDTKLEHSSLRKFYEDFHEQKDLYGVIALPSIFSLRHGKASDYNALKNNYTLFSAKPHSNYFTTQMGAIRKKIFNELGGFDERFKSADIEDIEFGMRIPPAKIFIDKEIVIGHHFPNFSSILRKYFRRAILLSKTISKNRKLSDAHANRKGMISVMIALASFISLVFSGLSNLMFFIFLLAFFFFVLINMKLFMFGISNRGRFYIFQSIFFEYIFSLAIGLGGIIGVFSRYLGRA
jgi:glycosyltransferase involved in cell wall biosynthesis